MSLLIFFNIRLFVGQTRVGQGDEFSPRFTKDLVLCQLCFE